jgi:hypothetical protein
MRAPGDGGVERHVAGKVERAGRAVRVEPARIAALLAEDQGELAEGRGMVLPGLGGEGDGFGEGGSGLRFTVEEEEGFGAGRGAPIAGFGFLWVGDEASEDVTC